MTMRPLLAALALLLAGSGLGSAEAQDLAARDLPARGAYLAKAADCAACHTAPGGKPFAGGLGIETPLGKIVSTNITPSKSHGIGGYSFEQFSRAVREGVRADGGHLYPAMPYTAYSKITDEDIRALHAYFTQSVAAVDTSPEPTNLPFPFNIRLSMAGWNLLFLNKQRFVPTPGKSEDWNRGAYLAEALAHCGTCHTPRNALMAEDAGRAYAGASLGTWYAPNITSDNKAGIGGWSEADLTAYLRSGRTAHAQAGGPMLEAIDKSLSGLTQADMSALVAYIRDLPASPEGAPPVSPTQPAPISNDLALMRGDAPAGMTLYATHCATCHQASGEGGLGLPSLVGNAAFTHPTADNAVMAILQGIWPEHGQAMPGFARVLSDKDVAELANALFRQFGNGAVQTSAARVAELKAGGTPSPLLPLARAGMVGAGLAVLLFFGVAVFRRRRSRPHPRLQGSARSAL